MIQRTISNHQGEEAEKIKLGKRKTEDFCVMMSVFNDSQGRIVIGRDTVDNTADTLPTAQTSHSRAMEKMLKILVRDVH